MAMAGLCAGALVGLCRRRAAGLTALAQRMEKDCALTQPLTLISHHLCPYVQRAVIALSEKGVAFERVDVDLANKPAWFTALSPLGKTPVLKVGSTPIFESAVILEYLEDTQPRALHPTDPLHRAQHRAMIEYGSSVLNDIAGFYSASDAQALPPNLPSRQVGFA